MRCHLCKKEQACEGLLDGFLPRSQLQQRYCQDCLAFFIKSPKKNCCQHCGSLYQIIDGRCENCCFFWKEYQLKIEHYSPFRYSKPCKELVWKVKHDSNYTVLKELSFILKSKFEKKYQLSKTLFVPYPTDIISQRMRGFNFPTAMLEEAELPYLDLFEMIPEKNKQHKNNLQNRLRYCQQSLLIKKGVEIPTNKNLIIFDDIFTSGATIMGAILTLHNHTYSSYDSASLFR